LTAILSVVFHRFKPTSLRIGSAFFVYARGVAYRQTVSCEV